ncbi:taurine ABC transporter substrate-binding protein [Loigolactobacillus zhaoyuanensis]|uniref:ABC transporter substrate-binding protein n=1 Tax=Loigolactobacillus zhaoyuanensis TaxID=2486017 RepID=A0ABW8UHM1_9LACO|nr:ABC transporter substrate-binding protein [Loigolactobacillus zhaoyuanensis]
MVKKLLTLMTLLFCALTLTSCSAAAHQQPKKVVRIGILQVPNDVAAARQRQTLRQACAKLGYLVKYISFDSGVDANKALLSGSVDLATMGDTNAVVALAAKIPAKLVWINDIIGSNEALVVKKGQHIQRPQDLAGKKIATPFASTSHYSLMMYLEQHHLTGKVQLVDMQTPEIVAAWQRGDIDGAYTWQPSLDHLTGQTAVVDSAAMADQGALTANVTLATNKFRQHHRRVLRQIIAALSATHSLYQTNPSQIYHVTAQQMSITSRAAKKQIGSSKWLTAAQMPKFMTTTFLNQLYGTSQFMWRQQTLNKYVSRQQCRQFIDINFIKGGGSD